MEYIYFQPGEVVTLKEAELKAPNMLVKGTKKSMIKSKDDKTNFQGIICVWFTVEGLYQEQVFNTKDLIHTRDL